MPRGKSSAGDKQIVLYQICRAGDEFDVGDGPFDLSSLKTVVLGRGAQRAYDARAAEDLVLVPDPWMSTRHASLTFDGPQAVVRDEGSTNGVLVNGKRVDEVALETGDLIETGRTFWVYLVLAFGPPLPAQP